MVNIFFLFRFASLLVLFWLVFRLAAYLTKRSAKRQQFLDEVTIETEEIEKVVKKYGRNTNAVVHLYGDLKFFKPDIKNNDKCPVPLVGYIPLDNENIMVTDPLCNPSDIKAVLKEFVHFSQKEDKDSLIFPIDSITAKALILYALKSLREANFDFASLGIASLAELDQPGVNQDHHLLNRLLVHVFNKHETLMKFKSMYHFKKKFGPTDNEPAYLAFYPPKFKLSFILAIGSLFSTQGILGSLIYKWHQWRAGNQPPRPLSSLLTYDVITLARPVPFNFREFVNRCKFTCFIFFLNTYTYLHSVSRHSGDLEKYILNEYGFNFADFLNHKWYILVTSNFLHFNYPHLLGNMTLLLIFGGVLEFIGGTKITAAAYLIALNANLPTTYILLPIFKTLDYYDWHVDLHYLDVGASLGIMGVLGALLHFVKYKKRILLITFFALTAFAISQNNFMGIDHSIALLIGYGVGYIFFNRGYPKSTFQNLFVSYDSSSQNKSEMHS